MLLEKRITMSSTVTYRGTSYELLPGNAESTLEAFLAIRHHWEYHPCEFEKVSATELQLSWFAMDHAHVEFIIPGGSTRVTAEKQTYTFTGDPETMRPLIEYVWRLHERRPKNPAAAFGPFPADRPSWLPALLLFENGCGTPLLSDLRILKQFGMTDDTLLRLKYPRVLWITILEATLLWFVMPEKTLGELLGEYVVPAR